MGIQTRGEFDPAELRRLIGLYRLEEYLFEKVSRRFVEDQTLTPYDFFAIVTWKSNRSKTKIKVGLATACKSVEELMREVSQAATPEAKVQTLLDISGIGVAIASALLAVCYPEQFTVLDYRVWASLKAEAVEPMPPHYPQDAAAYVQYCKACSHLANGASLSLRNLDRALWAKSWEEDLLLVSKSRFESDQDGTQNRIEKRTDVGGKATRRR